MQMVYHEYLPACEVVMALGSNVAQVTRGQGGTSLLLIPLYIIVDFSIVCDPSLAARGLETYSQAVNRL